MKRLILIITMLLTAAFAHPAAANKIVPCSGFLAGTETSQFEGGKIILDGTASGSSSMGDFTYTYHGEFDLDRLTGVESGQLAFANGDSVKIEGFAIAENSGLTMNAGTLASMTELLHFTSGSGRFAGGVGSLVVQRSQNIGAANYAGQTDIYGSFKGYYIAVASANGEESEASALGDVNADPDDSVVLVCYHGRQYIVPGNRLSQYLDRHPGSYVGRCEEPTKAAR